MGIVAGVPNTMLALAGGGIAAGGIGGFAVHALLSRRGAVEESDALASLRDEVAGRSQVGLVVPENASVDSLAATVGLRALCKEWGVSAPVFSRDRITSEDGKAFCNLFDVDIQTVDEAGDGLAGSDGAIVVGGGGPLPSFGNNPPVVAVVRHRPTAAEYPLVVARSDDGATSTTVARLLSEADVIPDQRVATALLYGIRAGTREFRRVRGEGDYEAASYLHDYADHGRIEALRAPGMSSETFDVIGTAIANRERQASVAVTNVGEVPAVSALEEASDTLLRLDGVSNAAAFGRHEDTVVVNCRADDVRTNALDVVERAFEDSETAGGNADVATARVPLGLFGRIDDENQDTLDDLIDASTRSALFGAFETA
ncbi:MAG: bifunctional oligoribonuclease/PAP phosphatase NrnA [Halobacteriaceae archaeon]